MNDLEIKLSIPSTVYILSFLRQLVGSVSRNGASLNAGTRRRCLHVLVEGVNNAIFHAHGADEKKDIEIGIQVKEQCERKRSDLPIGPSLRALRRCSGRSNLPIGPSLRALRRCSGRSDLPIGPSLRALRRCSGRSNLPNKVVIIKIKDRGPGFDLNDVSEPPIDSEHGRGLLIIRGLADDVSYSNNTLKMRLYEK